MSKFLQKHGGYIIDYTFCVLSVAAVIDFFVRDSNHTAAFLLVALYAFVVTRRFKYLRNLYLKEIEELKNK